MKVLTWTLAALLGTSAGAVTFGGLNIVPKGAQNLNLQTGVTEMPQGGTVTDRKAGLTLVAAQMTVKEGETLQARGVTLKTGAGGSLKAEQLRYDLKSGVMTASGKVTYSDSRMRAVQASSMQLYVKTGFVVAKGGVKAASPALSAQSLIFDPNTMQALVSGPYTLNAGDKAYKGEAGQRVLLRFAGNALTNAVQRPAASDLSRFAPYLK